MCKLTRWNYRAVISSFIVQLIIYVASSVFLDVQIFLKKSAV